ncbi:hypothetical protein BKA10_001274 [Microbacterium invictum]|uniref:Uncharacterized protein n=1 Tax=Microbacterium invictum TaxID=515415 RepID=A0AA40SNG4_9MICO|nr:hypothetical protein [Microbacterium invictum]
MLLLLSLSALPAGQLLNLIRGDPFVKSALFGWKPAGIRR